MQGADKTINTKVGLDLPMSEQVRQRQVTLNEGKTLVTCIKTRVFSPTPPPPTLIPDEGPLLETSNLFLSPR